MEQNEKVIKGAALLQGIDNDEILTGLANTLKHFTEEAKGKKDKLERRACEIEHRLREGDFNKTPVNTYDIDAIEKAVEIVETSDMLGRKAIALRKASYVSWTQDEEYRDAMVQYLTYINPVLFDLEKAKHDVVMRTKAVKNELNKLGAEHASYERKIEELFRIAGLVGEYAHTKDYSSTVQGRQERSDGFANGKRKEYMRSFRNLLA